MTRRRDPFTLDIFRDYEPPADVVVRHDGEVSKGGTLDVQISRILSVAMERSGKSRDVIAEEMSAFLGHRVSKDMLDGYASPARRDHKITLERFIALIDVTDSRELLAFVCSFSGMVIVPEKYSEIIELWRRERAIEEHTRARDTLLSNLRGLK
jgi:hypothetical protein